MSRVILVCGGRKFGAHDLKQRSAIFSVLDGIHAERPITLIVHGDARGADRCAKRWAETRGVREVGYPADWEDTNHPDADIRYHANGQAYDASAGKRRNQTMLTEHPDIELCVAFPGEGGTADMCRRAARKGILVEHPLG